MYVDCNKEFEFLLQWKNDWSLRLTLQRSSQYESEMSEWNLNSKIIWKMMCFPLL